MKAANFANSQGGIEGLTSTCPKFIWRVEVELRSSCRPEALLLATIFAYPRLRCLLSCLKRLRTCAK